MEIRLKEEGDDDDDDGDEDEEFENKQQQQDLDEKEEEIMDSEDENHETHIHQMNAEEDRIEAGGDNDTHCETVTPQEEGGFEANIVDGNFIIRIPNQHNQEQSLAALQQLSEQSANVVDMNSEIVEEIEIGHQEVLHFLQH